MTNCVVLKDKLELIKYRTCIEWCMKAITLNKPLYIDNIF